MFDFHKVDSIINDFTRDKQLVCINKNAKTDWCQFEYRSISWKSNGLNHLIEICPKLKSDCTYDKWDLTSISTYDENRKRFFCKHSFLVEVSFQALEEKLNTKLDEAYSAINVLQRKDLVEYIELESIS